MLPEAAAALAPASAGSRLTTLIYVSGLGLGNHQCWRRGWELLFSKAGPSCSDVSSSRPSPTGQAARMGAATSTEGNDPAHVEAAGQVGTAFGTGLNPCWLRTRR